MTKDESNITVTTIRQQTTHEVRMKLTDGEREDLFRYLCGMTRRVDEAAERFKGNAKLRFSYLDEDEYEGQDTVRRLLLALDPEVDLSDTEFNFFMLGSEQHLGDEEEEAEDEEEPFGGATNPTVHYNKAAKTYTVKLGGETIGRMDKKYVKQTKYAQGRRKAVRNHFRATCTIGGPNRRSTSYHPSRQEATDWLAQVALNYKGVTIG